MKFINQRLYEEKKGKNIFSYKKPYDHIIIFQVLDQQDF